MRVFTFAVFISLSLIGFADPLERFTPESMGGSVALKDKLVGTTWIYKWRGREYNFGFNPDGTISKLQSWSMVRWVVIAPNEVALIGSSDRMVLLFNQQTTAFNTMDWDGRKSSGVLYLR